MTSIAELTFRPLEKKQGLEILCWRYLPPLDYYNFDVEISRVRYGTTILKPKAEIICRNAPLTRKRCVTLTLKRTLLPTHFFA
jgi:hypothetical protein